MTRTMTSDDSQVGGGLAWLAWMSSADAADVL